MFKWVLGSILLSLCLTSWAANTQHIIIFGDSLSDAAPLNSPRLAAVGSEGNNDWVQFCPTSEGKSVCGDFYYQGSPVSNLTTHFSQFIHAPNQQFVRVNWSNFIALNFPGSTATPHNYLITYRQYLTSPKSYANLTDYNINFAFASAETGSNYIDDLHGYNAKLDYNPNVPNAFLKANCSTFGSSAGFGFVTSCVPGIGTQIEDYYDITPHQQADSNTLYLIWGGANDIFYNIGKMLTLAHQKDYGDLLRILADFETTCADSNTGSFTVGGLHLSCPANNLQHDVQSLIQHGATPKNIFVFEMPDLSLAPAAKAYPQFLIQAIVNAVNRNLHKKMAALSTQLNIYPTYNTLDNLSTNAKQYGFSQLSQSCVAAFNQHDPSVSGNPCYGYLFYNSKHPSGHTEQCLASGIQNYLNCKLAGQANCEQNHVLPEDDQCSVNANNTTSN